MEEDYLKLLEELEKLKLENLKLKHSVRRKKHGLIWMDIEEDFENRLPILKEKQELEIKNNDNQATTF